MRSSARPADNVAIDQRIAEETDMLVPGMSARLHRRPQALI
ncbi:hypothetical protein [Saccharopolyspora endophytica]|nr:hypothetical protein [Saccharopolyspora endophytica]